jgi:hypothetical protein
MTPVNDTRQSCANPGGPIGALPSDIGGPLESRVTVIEPDPRGRLYGYCQEPYPR